MFEQLESRRLLSAVMKFSDGTTVSQGGSGSLTIKADNKNAMNVTVIENGISQVNPGPAVGLGNVLVSELNSTTGQYEEVIVTNVKTSKPIKIQGGKGSDTITFDGTSLYADIKGEDGNDSITFIDRGNGGTSVDGGKGNDTITAVFSRNASISGGSGDDMIVLDSSGQSGANFNVQGGGGNDTFVTYGGNAKIDGSGCINSLFDGSGGAATYTLKNIQSTQTI